MKLANNYLILGPIVDGEVTWWNGHPSVNEWTVDENYATNHTRCVLALPLPIGATSIVETASDRKPVVIYTLLPTQRDPKIFEKTC